MALTPPTLDQITAKVNETVLAGRQMPPDFLLTIGRMEDAGDRMLAIVYLRRSGLLTGAAVDLDHVVFRREIDSEADLDAVTYDD